MAYRKHIIVISGGKNKGMVKLNGVFDGVSNVGISCLHDLDPGHSSLYIIGEDVAKIEFEGKIFNGKTAFKAKNEVSCVLKNNGAVLIGTTAAVFERKRLFALIDEFENAARRTEPPSGSSDREEGRQDEEAEDARPEDAEEGSSKNPDDSAPENEAAEEPRAPGFEDTAEAEPAPEQELRDDPAESKAEAPEKSCANCAEKESEEQPPAEDEKFDPEAGSPLSGAAAFADAIKTSKGAEPFDFGVTYTGDNFYQAIKPQLDELFVCYPEEKQLNAIVPNSTWVRVDTEDDFYVVGVLFDLDVPTYICYGVPGAYNVKPPSDIADVCVWLPLGENRAGDGYWIIYQSAVDGKCVKSPD